MSFHIGGTPINAETFRNMTSFQVSEIFQIPIDREVKRPDMPYLTLTEPSELKPLADGIADVLKTTGEFLTLHKYPDLASFILDVTKQKPRSAAFLVEQLVRNLPGLQDSYVINGQPVHLLKKAQILTYHVWMFFKDQDPERFAFDDINELTVFADNVVPTLLIHLGVIEIPDAWQQDMTENRVLSETTATTLRAASVVACQRIVERSAELGPIRDMNEGALDVYLWRLGKVGDYRKVPRFALRDTVMF